MSLSFHRVGNECRILWWWEALPPGGTVLSFSDSTRALDFLRPLLFDTGCMVALRRFLAEDSFASTQQPDTQILAQVAQRVLSGKFRIVRLDTRKAIVPVPTPAQGPKPAAKAKTGSPKPIPIKLRFQICGGDSAGLGIQGADYLILQDSVQVDQGKTDGNGEITFQYLPGKSHVVRIFNTDYEVRLDPQLPPINRTEGWQKRLEYLGYITGYQLEPLGY